MASATHACLGGPIPQFTFPGHVDTSSFTSTRIRADLSDATLADLVRRLPECGWVWGTRPEAGRPSLFEHSALDGDEHDWASANLAEAPGIISVLDARRTFAGISIHEPAAGASASIIINWPSEQFRVLWGADCRRDPSWPRAIDCGWIMATLKGLVRRPQLDRQRSSRALTPRDRPESLMFHPHDRLCTV